MPAYDKEISRFAGLDAQVVGISVDSVYSHIAWQRHEIGMLHYPLCSDFFPHGEVARRYGIFREGPPVLGVSDRAIFIVDKTGQIAYSCVYPLNVVPENGELFAALEKLQARAGVV